jgi:hypothetical protein
VQLSGPPDPGALAGRGELEWVDGELPGISLARSAGLDHIYDRETMEERPGLDRFDSLGARFRVAGDEAHVDELTLIQPGAAALVRGPLSLRDGVASFTGQVRFDDPELSGPALRPILRMAGRLDQLETHISEGRPEVAQMEAAMIQAIHRAEARQRERGPGR